MASISVRGKASGQTLIIVALAIIVLLSFVGLAFDGGRALSERRKMQNAAEAGALVGATEVGKNSDQEDIYEQIERFAVTLNGANSFSATYYSGSQPVGSEPGPPPSGSTGTCVTATTTFQTAFMELVGIPTITISARACGVSYLAECPVGGYALWAGSNTSTCANTINWSGGSYTVNGNLHTNNDINVSGTGNVLNGRAEYQSGDFPTSDHLALNPSANNPITTTTRPYPIQYDLADYQPGGRAAVAAQATNNYYPITTVNNFPACPPDGLYYVSDSAGHLNLSINSTCGGGNHRITIVSRGTINISGGSSNYSPFIDALLFYSTSANACNNGTPAISMSGSNNTWSGIVYAPNGEIAMSGSGNTTLTGSLIGNTLNMSGSSLTLSYSDSYCPPAYYATAVHLLSP
jgi:hypothetical protein